MKLHIGNLSTTVSDSDLTEMITAIARPTSVVIIRDRDGLSKGFGFAEFATDDEANAVISTMNGRDIAGQPVKLGEAKPRRADARQA